MTTNAGEAPEARAAHLLVIEDLVVRYGRIKALAGVSLSVGAGEVVAIVGPNGAGKTTLLSAIAGIVPAAAGAIAYDGASLRGRSLEAIVRRGIALVPEGRHVFAGLTVRENLAVGATIRTDAAAVAAEIAAFLTHFPILGERRDEPAGRLSGGEQQQLVIARALLSKPRLLMLDEPSLGLAPAMTDRVYAIIDDVRRQGMAVLVVEQNADRALAVADRTYVLNAGLVRMSGPSAVLAADPAFELAYFGTSMREAS